MSLSFCSFSSGSDGNCYLVKTDSAAVLVDVGISGKKILEGLDEIKEDREKVRAVLLTHEHIDHVKSLRAIGKKLPHIKVYANSGTWPHIKDSVPEDKRETFVTGEDFLIEDIKVRPFRTSHDASESVGFSFINENCQISIITDTGYVTDEAYDFVKDADVLVMEANHDVNILRMCRYPYSVKRRIAGNEGHLSNEAAAECILKIVKAVPKARHILLAHLSKENNSPDLAHLTVKNILEEGGFYIGRDFDMNVICRNIISPVYTVR